MTSTCAGLKALSIGLALIALSACAEEPPPEVVKNGCLTNLNCPGEDEVCEQSTLMCVRLHTVEPYQVVLQVQPENTSIELPDAGRVSLVAQTAFELGTLDAGIDDRQLEVPAAVRRLGRVQRKLDGGMEFLESELTLTPRMSEARLRNTVVNSGQNPTGEDDAGAAINVEADLDPSLSYDLRVQPLLTASKQLPPLYSSEPYDPNTPLEVEFGEMGERSARLTSYDGKRWGGRRIRLEDETGSRVMSSIVEIDGGSDSDVDAGADGRFSLFARQDVLTPAGLSEVRLVTDLSRGDDEYRVFPRWQVKIAIAGSSFREDAIIAMPNVPSVVTIEGDVLNADTGQPLANANLEFVSEFEVEEEAASDANWCRQPALPQLACSARLSQQTDARGHFERVVVPGRYRVFVQPDRSSSPDRGTFATEVLAETSPGFKTQKMEVRAATLYKGTVKSSQGQGMPNVTISGRALGLKEMGESFDEDELEPELAVYNRNLTAVTDARGRFSIYPDIGRYDFTIETPAESGFAWMLCPNYVIQPRDPEDTKSIQLSPFVPPTPVILAGSVEHAGVALPNARLEAYAVWGERLLLVARGVSDAEGKYRLAMPPQLPPVNPANPQEERCPVVLKPPPDAGLETMDSGLLAEEGGVSAPDSAR